jgi:hypothetical protein
MEDKRKTAGREDDNTVDGRGKANEIRGRQQ